MAEEDKILSPEEKTTSEGKQTKPEEEEQQIANTGEEEKSDDNKEEQKETNEDDNESEKEIKPEDVDLNNPNEVSEALNQKGLDYEEMAEEYMATGTLSEDTMKKLNAAGIPKEMVDGYIQGFEARVELEQNEIAAVVGGREKLEEIKNWASQNLSKERIVALNAIRNKEEIELVLKGLKADMEDKEGKTPEYQKGTGDKAGETGYRSQAEMFEAIKDPKYQKDPAYRADVQKKIAASREAGIDLGIY